MSQVLDRSTLVLNRHWQPVGVTTVARALVMLWNEVARVIDPDDYSTHDWESWLYRLPRHDAPVIRTARHRVGVPEVVTLGRYDRLPGAAVCFSRRNVAKRDHHTCQYCGAQPGWEAISIDHVIPRAQGGPTNWTNCVASCLRCNAQKADRTPEQAGMTLRKHPTRPAWNPLLAVHGVRVPSWSRFLGEDSLTANVNASAHTFAMS
jgi:5-methylcytosine-specific restriction endonuclease McrA